MSEAVQLALINNAPLILAALGTLLSTVMGIWSVIRSGKAVAEAKSTKQEVNGGLAKMLGALKEVSEAKASAARAEGMAEVLTATASTAPKETVIVPGTASDRRKPE